MFSPQKDIMEVLAKPALVILLQQRHASHQNSASETYTVLYVNYRSILKRHHQLSNLTHFSDFGPPFSLL